MRDNNQLRENIKENANTLKSKESELEKVNKENRALEKNLEEIAIKMATLQKKQNDEKLKCLVCAINFDSKSSVSQHVRE